MTSTRPCEPDGTSWPRVTPDASALRIELPDETHAATLRRHLQPFDVETVAVNGHCEVRIELLDRNPESRVTDALNAIDLWLLSADVPFVRVHLDGSTYTLHAPRVHELA